MKQEHKFNGEGLFEIPDLWTWAISNEVCSSVRDGTHDTPKYVDNGIPLVTSKNLKNGYINFDTAKFITIEDHKQISFRSEVENGDILFAMIGTIGSPIVVNTDRQFSIKNIGLFKKNEAVIQSLFLKYWLLSEPLNKILEVQRFINGTTQKFISLGSLRAIPIPLPPLNEQRRIVNAIEQLTDRSNKARTALAEVPKLIEQFRQSVLAAAFRGDLTADWRKQNPDIEPVSALLELISYERRFQYEQLCIKANTDGRKKPRKPENLILESRIGIEHSILPETWTWLCFKDISATTQYSMSSGPFGSALGTKDYKENGIPIIRGQNIQQGKFISENFVYITEGKAEELIRSAVYPGDIIIVAVGSSGQAALVPKEIKKAILSQNCNKFTIDTSLAISDFIVYLLQNAILKSQMQEKTTDTVRQFLSLTNLKELIFPIPLIDEQRQIVKIIDSIFETCDKIESLYYQHLEEMNQLDRSILAKAFRGELVPQDPSDEPAAVLLDRIRAERATSIPKQRGKTTRKNSSKQLSINLE